MHESLALGAVAVGGLLVASREASGSDSGSTEQQPAPAAEPEPTTGTPTETFDPVTDDGEVGVSGNGVVYDDPETGTQNDEPEDDSNASFESIGLDGYYAETYDPDTQDGSSAPSSGTISDTGTSDNWGDAGEDENDDLSQRAADSEMDDDMKSAFDRLANYDDPSNL